MYQISWIDQLPLISIFVFFIFAILIILGFGYHSSQRLIKQGGKGGYGPMSGGIASLLAFMLALSFSMAANRNDDRKKLVVTEANSIGTTYLRADFLPEPFRTEAKSMLKDYIDIRLSNGTSMGLQERIAKSEDLQKNLWQQVISIHKINNSRSLMLYSESLNEMIDVHTLRVNRGIHGRIPDAIWFTLFALTFIGVILIGLQSGENNKRNVFVASIPFALAFSIVLTLIVELDRPTRSLITVSQSALVDLQQSIK